MSIRGLAATVGGRVVGPAPGARSVSLDRVCIHSDDAGPGAVFFALTGSVSDGHDHLAAAFARGAEAAVVRDPSRSRGPAIVVEDPGTALLRMAGRERRSMAARCVGVTGSCGKTTTKDLIAAVLARRFRTHASPASFNNQVGVPLTILGAPPATGALVCEIGAGVVGEIAGLCRVAAPDVGVVTNVGAAHLETFGSREAIARAKGELVEALPRSGVAVLNADDPVVARFRSRTAADVVTFGSVGRADVRAERVELDDCARPAFDLVVGSERVRVHLALVGAHMVANALASVACGVAFGLSVTECAAGVQDVRPATRRVEPSSISGGLRVLDDCYNASPESMAAGLRAAGRLAGAGGCIAVLGEMAELGPAAPREHRRAGRLAATLGVDRLVLLGPHAADVAAGAIEAGMRSGDVVRCGSIAAAAAAVRTGTRRGDLVFVKASRVAGFERLVELLRTEAPD